MVFAVMAWAIAPLIDGIISGQMPGRSGGIAGRDRAIALSPS
ncbi:MAG TPA: hypothetical protein V6D46_10945 [Coleofasciculaceae cyanobacterium]